MFVLIPVFVSFLLFVCFGFVLFCLLVHTVLCRGGLFVVFVAVLALCLSVGCWFMCVCLFDCFVRSFVRLFVCLIICSFVHRPPCGVERVATPP